MRSCVLAPGLIQLDPTYPQASPHAVPATAWRHPDQALDNYISCEMVAA